MRYLALLLLLSACGPNITRKCLQGRIYDCSEEHSTLSTALRGQEPEKWICRLSKGPETICTVYNDNILIVE